MLAGHVIVYLSIIVIHSIKLVVQYFSVVRQDYFGNEKKTCTVHNMHTTLAHENLPTSVQKSITAQRPPILLFQT
jgi:hypothetical protein